MDAKQNTFLQFLILLRNGSLFFSDKRRATLYTLLEFSKALPFKKRNTSNRAEETQFTADEQLRTFEMCLPNER